MYLCRLSCRLSSLPVCHPRPGPSVIHHLPIARRHRLRVWMLCVFSLVVIRLGVSSAEGEGGDGVVGVGGASVLSSVGVASGIVVFE